MVNAVEQGPATAGEERAGLLRKQIDSNTRFLKRYEGEVVQGLLAKRMVDYRRDCWEWECELADLEGRERPEYPDELKTAEDAANTRLEMLENDMREVKSMLREMLSRQKPSKKPQNA